ncbi:MAG: LAGLIDADG family homing endonuclease [Promethearchaeota archaeon]
MLLEKITSEELEFMEDFHDPVALIEVLFSNFDNLAHFDEEELGEVRNYQLPMLSYECTIDTDIPGLTRKEKFALRKGVGDIYNFGARNYGKCEWEESYCLLSTGEYKQYKELINTEQEVVSLNQNTLKLENKKAIFRDNGIKNCYKIITDSGKSIIVTENHPLLTSNGWLQSNQLNIGDFIATPRELPIEGNKEVNENLAKILGYLIGDGGCTTNSIRFTNNNEEILQEFFEILKYYNCKSKKYNKYDYVISKINGRKKEQNLICKLVQKYKINKSAKNKTIPEEVFTWKNKYIAILLNRLFACDAHINKITNTIEITLASEKLIKQISSLLLRFGIHSYYSYKQAKYNDKFFDSWRLVISSKNAIKFITKIGIKSKDTILLKYTNNSTTDRIPVELFKKYYNLFSGYKKELKLRNYRNYNSSRIKWQELASKTKIKEIEVIANSDIYWETIKSIEFISNLKTVAVTVPDNETYISNDIISHNTKVTEELDLIVRSIHFSGEHIGFASYDFGHIRGVLDKIRDGIENHPIISSWKPRIKTAPPYIIYFRRNKVKIEGVNMNINSRNPGNQFFQKHFPVLYIEEASFETEEVFEKRREAISEIGCIYRIAGMTNFTKHSPAGKAYQKALEENLLVSYPHYINPNWDEIEKQDRIEEYGGESSIGYRVYVKGEIVESGISTFDMARIRQECYPDDNGVIINHFEINKENFKRFEDILILARPKNATKLYLSIDVGESASSELVFHSEIWNDDLSTYRYIYNITLYNLTDDEQATLVKWLISKMSIDVVAIDCGDGTGRAIYNELELTVPEAKDRLVKYKGTLKTEIGEEKDDDGEVKLDKDGEILYKYEFMSEWSVKRLQTLLYTGRIFVPRDAKFDKQFNSVIGTIKQGRTTYRCLSNKDHLFDAWRVFSIAQWKKEYASALEEIEDNDWGTGVM